MMTMKRYTNASAPGLFIAALCLAASGCGVAGSARESGERAPSAATIADGRRVFRFETFGDEKVWTDTLHMNEVVEKNVDPTTALSVGLKVDADALPAGILQKADLKSPATTVALLKMNAVVGLQATGDAENHITKLGVPVRCATPPWTTRSCPALAGGKTGGRIEI